MATYPEIENCVKATHGFTLKPCWIAHVKADQWPDRLPSSQPHRPGSS